MQAKACLEHTLALLLLGLRVPHSAVAPTGPCLGAVSRVAEFHLELPCLRHVRSGQAVIWTKTAVEPLPLSQMQLGSRPVSGARPTTGRRQQGS